MGKYSSKARQAVKPKSATANSLWQGIGCILIFVIPIFSYALSSLLVDFGAQRGWPIPPSWFQPIKFHPLLLRLQGLQSFIAYVTSIPHLKATLFFTAAITILIGGAISVLYAFMYRAFGPSRYGPTDAPPSSRKAKPYKR